jgi:hypothetical protein
MAKWPRGVATATPIFLKLFFYIKNKNYGQYEKFWIQLVKLKKIETLRGGLQKLKLWCSN